MIQPKRILSAASLTALLLFACNTQSPQEKLLQSYLQTNHNDQQLKLIEATPETPILASDSLKVINEIFVPARDSALMHLKAALVHANTAYETAKEGYETTDFEMLRPTFKETMDEAAAQQSTLLLQIRALETDCHGTDWEPLYKQVQHYESLGDAALLNPYSCTFTSNGTQQTQTVFMTADNTTVQGHLVEE